ncbi:MAG: PAS domain-containing protein [Acidimicrobiia bacterium]
MQRLAASRELLIQVLNGIDVGIVIVDAHFEVEIWNQTAERIFGWTESETVGGLAFDFIPPGEYPDGMTAETAFDAVYRTGSWRGEATQTRRDGSKFLAEVAFSAIRDADGEVTGYTSVWRNITGQRALEEEFDQLVN